MTGPTRDRGRAARVWRCSASARLADGEEEARMSEHDFDVVVIGGGQAGLAMGYYLREQGLRFAIVERGDSIAPAWPIGW